MTAAFHARACARPDRHKHSRSKGKRGVNKPGMVVQIQRKESTCSPTTPTRVHSIGVCLLAHILRQVSPQHPQAFWERGQTSSTYPNQSCPLCLITYSREQNHRFLNFVTGPKVAPVPEGGTFVTSGWFKSDSSPGGYTSEHLQ